MTAPDLFQEPERPASLPHEGPEVTLNEMIACAAREARLRPSVYPAMVRRGKMTAKDAAREIRRMEAILDYLRAQRENEIETQDGS